MKYSKYSAYDPEPGRCPSCGEEYLMDEEDFGICTDCGDTIAEWQEMYREMGLLVDDELNIIGTRIDTYEDENGAYPPIAKQYKADISVRRVGIITAPRIPPDHPNVQFSSGSLHREVFPAPDIVEARHRAIALVENPNTPEFQKCLDFYFVPFKTLQRRDWQDPIEPETETQIHSCSSHPFRVGSFKWIVTILLHAEESSATTSYQEQKVSTKREPLN